MPRVLPFRAWRYAAPGADVARRLLVEGHVDLPERYADPLHAAHLVEAAHPAALLRRWREQGAIAEDMEPAFHLLEVQPAGDSPGPRRPAARFVLGALWGGDGVEPLEESPRTPLPLAPVPTLAADDQLVLRALMAEAVFAAPADFEARAGGLLLRLWRIRDRNLERRLSDALDEVPLRPLAALPEDGPVLAAVASLQDPGLALRPLHRAIGGVETFDEATFLRLVPDCARLYEVPGPLTTREGQEAARERLATLSTGHHAVLLVLPGGRGTILRFRQGLDPAQLRSSFRSPTLRSLDLALLHALVFRTVLGLADPETPGHPQVFTVPTLETLVEQVERGTYQAGFALNPPPAWELRAVMEAAQRLPPRTVRLEPSPPAGLIFLPPER